jgi:hypothetical protein
MKIKRMFLLSRAREMRIFRMKFNTILQNFIHDIGPRGIRPYAGKELSGASRPLFLRGPWDDKVLFEFASGSQWLLLGEFDQLDTEKTTSEKKDTFMFDRAIIKITHSIWQFSG